MRIHRWKNVLFVLCACFCSPNSVNSNGAPELSEQRTKIKALNTSFLTSFFPACKSALLQCGLTVQSCASLPRKLSYLLRMPPAPIQPGAPRCLELPKRPRQLSSSPCRKVRRRARALPRNILQQCREQCCITRRLWRGPRDRSIPLRVASAISLRSSSPDFGANRSASTAPIPAPTRKYVKRAEILSL